jgi:hypothetical protein
MPRRAYANARIPRRNPVGGSDEVTALGKSDVERPWTSNDHDPVVHADERRHDGTDRVAQKRGNGAAKKR